MAYSSVFQVLVDLNLYLTASDGSKPVLGLFTAVAKERWPWIVTNWNSLYLRFKAQAAGDDNLESNLADFDNFVSSYLLGNTQNALENNQNYAKAFPFLLNVTLVELKMTAAEKTLVAKEFARVRQFDVSDFRSMLAYMSQQIANAASLIGYGDVDGSVIFGGQHVKQQSQGTFQDFIQIDALIKFEEMIEGIVFALKNKQNKPPNLLAFANQNIDPSSSVSINAAYLSYTAVPFYGSLEQMAAERLGDSKRWYELVTVNNLQPPFIDEYGTKYPMLSPGGVNTVTVDGTNTLQVQVGMRVRVGSLVFREEGRIIERKVDNDDGSMTLSLSGDQTLNSLRPVEQSYVRIYAPGTVTSGSMILIPLDVRTTLPVVQTPNSDVLRRLDQQLLAFGIDIARDTATGDFQIDSTGNFQMAVGLDNIQQAVYWLLRTELGELPWHPNYGVDVGIGTRFYGSETELTMITSIIKQNVLKDPRFKQVEVSRIISAGNGMSFTLLVRIGDSTTLLPLTFTA